MTARRQLRFANGHALAPAVSLYEAALYRFVLAAFKTASGGKCFDCGSTRSLSLARHDGAARREGIFGLAEIINATAVAGEGITLPKAFTIRCASCRSKLSAAKRTRPGRRRPRAAETDGAHQAGIAPTSAVAEVAARQDAQPDPRGVAKDVLRKPRSWQEALGVPEGPDPKVLAELRATGFEGEVCAVERDYDLEPLKRGQPPTLRGWIVTLANGKRQRMPAPAALNGSDEPTTVTARG